MNTYLEDILSEYRMYFNVVFINLEISNELCPFVRTVNLCTIFKTLFG